MPTRKWKDLSFTVLYIACLSANAQQSPQKFIQETKYLLYLPDGYASDSTKQWPLVLFLHGIGEGGNDLNKVKVHGPPKLVEQGKKFPFIIASPQRQHGGWDVEALYQFLTYIKHQYRVDNDRIYLTGLSMGGSSTWEFAMKHPEEFAAIVPIAGGGDTDEIWKLRHTPVWCFHGGLDNTVPLADEQKMIDALKKYNPDVRFTVDPQGGHTVWVAAYDSDSIYNWLLSHKKSFFQPAAVDSASLQPYRGTYVDTRGDTVRIVVDADKIKARIAGNDTPLKSAGSDLFYFRQDIPFDFRFVRNKNGEVREFLFWAETKREFKKIVEKK